MICSSVAVCPPASASAAREDADIGALAVPLVRALGLSERGLVTCHIEYVVDDLKEHAKFSRKAA